MIQKKSEDAVSPVIGIMLMLVVTIIIAGVIAVFGTGMVGNTETAPNVVLDVKILSNTLSLDGEIGTLHGPDFQILHVAGDSLDTDEIEIQMAWTDSTGTDHYSTYSAAAFKASGVSLSSNREQPMYVKTKVPDMFTTEGYATYGSTGYNYYFGDVILTPGLRLTATTDYLSDGVANKGSPFMDVIFNNGVSMSGGPDNQGVMQYLPVGTTVEITILHIPSDTIIYEKEVIVQ